MASQILPTKSEFIKRVTREKRKGAKSSPEARDRAASYFGFSGFKVLLASAKAQGAW